MRFFLSFSFCVLVEIDTMKIFHFIFLSLFFLCALFDLSIFTIKFKLLSKKKEEKWEQEDIKRK